MDEYIDRIILSLKKTQDKWKKDKYNPEYNYNDRSVLKEIVVHKHYQIMLVLNTYYAHLDLTQSCRLVVEGLTIEGMTNKKYEELKKASVKLLEDKNKRAVERKRLLLEEESMKVLRKLDNCLDL